VADPRRKSSSLQVSRSPRLPRPAFLMPLRVVTSVLETFLRRISLLPSLRCHLFSACKPPAIHLQFTCKLPANSPFVGKSRSPTLLFRHTSRLPSDVCRLSPALCGVPSVVCRPSSGISPLESKILRHFWRPWHLGGTSLLESEFGLRILWLPS